MKKIFKTEIESDNITLIGEDHNHIAYSLRMRVGDSLTVCDGKDDYICKIADIKKDKTTLSVIEVRPIVSEPDINVHLFMAALKGDKSDLTVQKCTELGIKSITPVVTAYTQVKEESIKIPRLQKIAEESAKQCGRGMIPDINPVIKTEVLIDKLKEFDKVLFFNETEENNDIKTVLSGQRFDNLAVIVGPEGGFKEKEKALLSGLDNSLSVSLGKRILRAETASIAVAAIIMYEAGQMK